MYLERGWAPLPVPYRQKKPVLDGWPSFRTTREVLPHHFNGAPQNIGVLLGEPSRGLTDVDHDCVEALDLAWSDARTLVVLGTSSATALEVVDLTVGTPVTRRQTAPDAAATTIAAAPGRVDLVGDDTTSWQQSGATWTRLEGLTDPVYPG